MNTQLLDQLVGLLVAEKPARSRVFERWGIDYCCGGKKALSEACAAKQLDAAAVMRDLETSDASPQPIVTDWSKEPLTALCDHIQKSHHGYLREALPRLTALTEKVAERHGSRDKRLIELKNLYPTFRSNLEEHMAKEEDILFPAIRSLEGRGPIDSLAYGIAEPIKVMLADHDNAGAALDQLRELTDGYVASPDACNTRRAMLDAFSELETDMHQHVHKENNILFPRALKMAAMRA